MRDYVNNRKAISRHSGSPPVIPVLLPSFRFSSRHSGNLQAGIQCVCWTVPVWIPDRVRYDRSCIIPVQTEMILPLFLKGLSRHASGREPRQPSRHSGSPPVIPVPLPSFRQSSSRNPVCSQACTGLDTGSGPV